MELHKALQQIIKTDGRAILTQPRLVNILSDLQAYQAMPAAKYIISSMITDGYMQQLLLIGKWDVNSERLMNKYVQETGFQFDMVSCIFQSIAFGLKWKQTLDVTSPSNTPVKPTSQNNGASSLNLSCRELSKRSEEFVSDYIEKCQEYIDSITYLKGNWEDELGAKITVTSNYEVLPAQTYLSWNIEIDGKMKIRLKQYSLSFHVAIYNLNGRLIGTVDGMRGNTKDYEIVETDLIEEKYYKNIANIGKVVIYWEND
ncbi:MAG: hypothetical protein KBT27_09495 [Prevotellaceae bacterium]|nr:hypothetical protein [Candidatus Faecinaster equi]